MFDWLLERPRIMAVARIIDEMSCNAHHLRETTGAPLHRYFASHPMLTNHRVPKSADRDQVHIFLLSGGRQRFDVLACDGGQNTQAWLAIAPDGDFAGVHVQSVQKGRYMVRIDRHSARPQGPFAAKLLARFVEAYAAVDTSA